MMESYMGREGLVKLANTISESVREFIVHQKSESEKQRKFDAEEAEKARAHEAAEAEKARVFAIEQYERAQKWANPTA